MKPPLTGTLQHNSSKEKMRIPLQCTREIIGPYICITICTAESSTDIFYENIPVLFSQLCPTDIMSLDRQTNIVNFRAGFPSIIFVYCKQRESYRYFPASYVILVENQMHQKIDFCFFKMQDF